MVHNPRRKIKGEGEGREEERKGEEEGVRKDECEKKMREGREIKGERDQRDLSLKWPVIPTDL